MVTMQRWMMCATTAALLGLACGEGPGTSEGGTSGTTGTGGGSSGGGGSGSSTGGALTEGGSGGATEGSGGTSGSSGGEATSSGGQTSTGSTSASSSGSGGGLCDDFVPPGCLQSGCPEGQKCDTTVGCNPSACSCDPMTGQINCTPDCSGGTCVDGVMCEPVPCNLFCEFGFKTDRDGCEICECNPKPDCGCQTDAECVKVTPGCCECNMGGKETAIAAACVDQLEPCPLPPDQVACPAVYLCTDAKAVCVNGACVLM